MATSSPSISKRPAKSASSIHSSSRYSSAGRSSSPPSQRSAQLVDLIEELENDCDGIEIDIELALKPDRLLCTGECRSAESPFLRLAPLRLDYSFHDELNDLLAAHCTELRDFIDGDLVHLVDHNPAQQVLSIVHHDRHTPMRWRGLNASFSAISR